MADKVYESLVTSVAIADEGNFITGATETVRVILDNEDPVAGRGLTPVERVLANQVDIKVPSARGRLILDNAAIKQNLFCVNRKITNIQRTGSGQTAIDIECEYETFITTPRLVEMGSGSIQVDTEVDRNGNPITVTYNGTTQVGTVSVNEASLTMRFLFHRELVNPDSYCAQYINTINSTGWRLFTPGQCRVVEITPTLLVEAGTFNATSAAAIRTSNFATNELNKDIYRIEVDVEATPAGWQPVVAYQDRETGTRPDDIAFGNGLAEVDYYTEIDFNEFLPEA